MTMMLMKRARLALCCLPLCAALWVPVSAWAQGIFPFLPPVQPAGAQKPVAAIAAVAASENPAEGIQGVTGVKITRPVEANTQIVPGVVLRFENADINDIIQAVLGDILHLNYFVDPSLQGRITLQTAGNISAADVYNILESVLSLHGISLVRDGKVYKVMRDVQANRDALTTAVGEQSPVVQVIPLRFVQASGLVGALKALLGPQALLTADPTNRHLIVVDRAQNVAKVIEMIATLDVDYLAKVRIRLVEIVKGDATELAREMDTQQGIFSACYPHERDSGRGSQRGHAGSRRKMDPHTG
jgi:general secretion pathway protein D